MDKIWFMTIHTGREILMSSFKFLQLNAELQSNSISVAMIGSLVASFMLIKFDLKHFDFEFKNWQCNSEELLNVALLILGISVEDRNYNDL